MKLAFHIARRYLVSKKSVNIINIISAISVVGVAVGTLALIVVLSAFNGIDYFIKGQLSNFDPDLKITVVEGKNFSMNAPGIAEVIKLDEVLDYAQVVEDNVLLRYSDRQKYAVLKGVGNDYGSFSGLDSTIVNGKFLLEKDPHQFAVVGQGIAYDLSVGLTFVDPIHVYYPKKEQKARINLEEAFNHDFLFPSGVFSIQQDIDSKYLLVPIEFARSIFELEGKITSLELKLKADADVDEVKDEVKAILGNSFQVQDRYEQHEFIYRVMRSEKWSSFLILSFILIIASFNLLGTLTMIILDKKDDILILESMGANQKLIRRIFLFEGWLISVSGAVVGMFLGVALVWAQKNFELLKFPGDGSFAISAYPVQLQFFDVVATFLIVLAIGFLAAWYPVKNLSNK